MTKTNTLSVIIITYNEEKNIACCLESVQFAREVIIVDSYSTDKTVEIAKTFSNTQIFTTSWKGFSLTKQFAVEKATSDWILWIDADEVVTADLRKEWENFAQKNDSEQIAAISINRKTFFLGYFVKHCGWFPDKIIRFFHKNRAKFNEKILHEGLSVNPKYEIKHFSSFLLHYSYSSLYQYFHKMNYYGEYGAKELIRQNKKIYYFQIFLNPFWAFFKSYFIKMGFLDGLIGLIICVGISFSNFIKYSNYFFLKKYGHLDSKYLSENSHEKT